MHFKILLFCTAFAKKIVVIFSGALSHYFIISFWLYPSFSRGDLHQLAGMYVKLLS